MQPKGPMGPWAHAGPKGPAYKLGAWCRSSPTGGIHFQKWVLDFEGMYLSILNMFSSVLGEPIPLWGYPPFSNCRYNVEWNSFRDLESSLSVGPHGKTEAAWPT